ncbi:MAG TPA: HDOD domain-containing protein [Gammaproteobacteria bacterium]|nr:HDOD domain-containing protein [Gammaproteobacteria bacterium]
MSENPKTWIDRWVKGQRLPALHRTVIDLDALYRKDDPFAYLSDVIHRDPGVTCYVFTYANSVQHQHFSMPVTTVEHAAMMLGLDRMKSVPGKLPVIEPATAEDGGKGLLHAYSRSRHAAAQAFAWAKLRADMVPWEVFAAALLYELGEMAVWAFQPEKAQEIEDLTHGAGRQSRTTAQLHVLGFTYNALSIELAQLWKLPLLVHDVLNHENAEKPRIKTILLANEIARAAEQDWYSETTISLTEEAAELLHVSYPDMVNTVHQTALVAANDYHVYGVTPAAAYLVTTPPPWLNNKKSASEKPVKGLESGTPSVSEQIHMEPQPQILEQTIRWFSDKHDKPPTLPAIMKQAVQGMHKGIGLYRVVFAACTPDQKGLKARVVCSTEKSAEFNQFYMELDPPHLFTRLMEKPMSIWINDENRERFGKLLPSSVLKALDADSFFASSVFVNNRPVGMFYCDCHRDSDCLDEERYKEFQHVCDFVTAAMGQFSKKMQS